MFLLCTFIVVSSKDVLRWLKSMMEAKKAPLIKCKVVALDQLQLRLKSWAMMSFGITNIFGSKLPQ